MKQIQLSGEEIELLRWIEEKGKRKIINEEKKKIAFKLKELGFISLEKGRKTTYVLTERGMEQLERVTTPSSIDLSSIVQGLDELKESLQSYHDELKLYIDQRLNKQSEILLKMVKTEKEGKIDEDTFLEVTREEYAKLSQTSPISPYVSIKLLRDFVCERLKVDRNTFDLMLLSIANKDPYTVQLSTSSGERGMGIIYGRSECHAAIIK